MSAPQTILDLVARFEQQLDSYKTGHYNETQLRREFLDPFFKALGWDIDNTEGYAEAYKDVIHEDQIRIGDSSVKAPDYCFRIGGTRKFFLEAKKPSIFIKEDITPAYQLRSYAWSAKLPLSILSDFEEFAFYDCRIKPKPKDSAAVARVFYCTFRDYAARWDEIAAIFSREAVLKGSFDRYVESSKAKKGTAEFDQDFLATVEGWRKELAQNLALRNPSLSQRELNFAVQRIIDRIIFLRICESRGIEDYGQLRALTNGDRIYQRLAQLFEAADTRYNSGLFHFKKEPGRLEEPDELTLELNIDDKLLRDIIRALYYPTSPYHFSVVTADILGQVYEQLLGKVIRLTEGHRAIVEEKPEVRKAGGVYYTPTYIVEYIVQQTVGKLVEGKTPKQVEKLRILDPACGSGSFLIGAYQFLLDWHLQFYMTGDPKKYAKGRKPAVVETSGGWKLTIDERKRILLNNIYGVDIDAQAVEVTKLSLLLKVLEGETLQTLQPLFQLFHERALPDLGNNIKCGNSLIGPDFYQQPDLPALTEEERYRINVFDWHGKGGFQQIMQAGGFDAVIGNPPYVVVAQDLYPAPVLNYLRAYEVAQYKLDLYHLFIQRGIALLKERGHLGFIVPNTWLTLKFTDAVRRHVLEQTLVREIVLFDHLVFAQADVHTALIFLSKEKAKPGHSALIRKASAGRTSQDIQASTPAEAMQEAWRNSDGFVIETRRTGKAGSLANRLISGYPVLESLFRASLGCQAYNSSKHTKEQIEKRVFHAAHKAGEDYLPELAGKDVSRYRIERTRGQWIKYGPWLHDYRTMDWLTGPRILIREIAGQKPYSIHAAYVEETYCHYKTILNVNPKPGSDLSMKYLVAVLNSRLMSFIFPFVSNKMVAQSFPRLSVGDIKKLPIPAIDLNNASQKTLHDNLAAQADQMAKLHKQLLTAKTPHEKISLERQIAATDAQIDQLVYELYGLTDDEIKLVQATATEAETSKQPESKDEIPAPIHPTLTPEKAEADAAHFFSVKEEST